MNCTQVEKLLPLHVGNDLPTEQTAVVSAHLTHCASCQTLAADFAASRAWLGAFTTPTFDEAVFDEMRAAVRQKIAQTEPQPTRLTLLTAWWRPRYVLATVVVLLLAGLSFYTYRQQRAPSKEPPVARNEVKPKTPEATPAPAPHSGTAIKTVDTAQQSPLRRSTRRPSITHKPRAAELAAQSVALTTDNADGALKQAANQLAARETTRIEFQTADPDIRIIWFAPKPNLASTSQRN